MTRKPIVLLFVLMLPCWLSSQMLFEFNAGLDVEMFKAGDRSHYYYNEINNGFDLEKWQVRPYQANLIGKLHFSEEWSVTARLLLERRLGRQFDQLQAPLLNVQWAPKEKNFQLKLGRFINPFGSFNSRQLPKQRSFIGLPLAYQYYVNISDQIGFVPNMGDVTKVPLDGSPNTWGSSTLYYGGYNTGIHLNWDIDPGRVNWKVALVNNAALGRVNFPNPVQFGLNTRLGVRPIYFWEQGISISHGSFLRDSEVGNQLADFQQYRQTLIGTDYKIGLSWFEFSGELIWTLYRTPAFDPENRTFLDQGESLNLQSFNAYLDIKYRLPFLARSFLAYRFDTMRFGQLESPTYTNSDQWDNPVLRHALAFGYQINELLLVRAYVATQSVDNKAWDRRQRVFRLMVSFFY